MPLDRESEAYVLAMTFLLRTPGAHVQRVICDPTRDVPRPLEDLLARWRRARVLRRCCNCAWLWMMRSTIANIAMRTRVDSAESTR